MKRLPMREFLLCGDQLPLLEEDANDDQAPIDPPLTNGSIRASLLQMAQAITT